MEFYNENDSVRTALSQFFEKFGFSEADYAKKWFAIYIGKFAIHLPNIPSRVHVAKFHDVHHVLTGYPANWRGEAEIGAWEIATGCRRFWVAWFLNFGAMMVGLVLWPRAIFRAFRRGRLSRTNLYHDFEYDEKLLQTTVGTLRNQLGLAAA